MDHHCPFKKIELFHRLRIFKNAAKFQVDNLLVSIVGFIIEAPLMDNVSLKQILS